MTFAFKGLFMRSMTVVAGLFFAVCIHGAALAQEPAAVGVPITAGTSLAEARETLAAAKLAELPMNKQFARLQEDDAWLLYSLDRRAELFLTYSTRTQEIRSLSVIYLADKPTSKNSDLQLRVQGVRFFADASYVVHFATRQSDRSPRKVISAAAPVRPPQDVPYRP